MEETLERRIAYNESRFREHNERVKDVVDKLATASLDDGRFAIMCECALSECDAMIDVSIPEYERVRSNGRWFVVRPDHMIPDMEVAVDRHDGHWVVEKLGRGGEVAEQLAR